MAYDGLSCIMTAQQLGQGACWWHAADSEGRVGLFKISRSNAVTLGVAAKGSAGGYGSPDLVEAGPARGKRH